MPSNTPLTDAINALTQYANETTGASDTTLSDAVGTLVAGYGGGGSDYVFEITECVSESNYWNTPKMPNTLSTGGYVEAELVLATQTNNPNLISVGIDRSSLWAWNTANAFHVLLDAGQTTCTVRQSNVSTLSATFDPTQPLKVKVDKDYIYINDSPVVATSSNIVNGQYILVGSNNYTGNYNYVRYK